MTTTPESIASTWLADTAHEPRMLAETETQLRRLRAHLEPGTPHGERSGAGAGPITGWLHAMARAATVLDGIADIERGDGRYLILVHADTALREARDALARAPDQGAGAALIARTSAMQASVRDAIEALHPATWLTLTPPGEPADRACIANRGPVALRHIEVTTSNDTVLAATPYLAGYQEATIDIDIDTNTIGKGQLRFHARTIEGAPITGTVQARAAPQPRGDSVAGTHAATARRIARTFARPGATNPVILDGDNAPERHAILDALCAGGPLEGWAIARCTLRIVEGEGTRGVRAQIGDAIEHALAGTRPAPSAGPDTDTAEALRPRTESTLERAGAQRILLIIDNADTLCEAIARGEGGNAADNLRALVQSEPRLGLVIAGGEALRRERMRYESPFYGLGIVVHASDESQRQHDARAPATSHTAPNPRTPGQWPFGTRCAHATTGTVCPEDFAEQPVAIIEIAPGEPTTIEIEAHGVRIEGQRTRDGRTAALWLTDAGGREASWSETEQRCAHTRFHSAPTATHTPGASVRAIDRALLTTARAIHALELPRFSGHLQTVQRRCSQWQRLIHRMRRSSGARWSSWSGRAVRQGNWPESSGVVPRPSVTGYVKPVAMKGVVMTV